MHQVMQKAQELAEAILESRVYTNMKESEAKLTKDAEASAAMAELIEKRQIVEDLLVSANMDPAELAEANEKMEKAEEKMNAIPLIAETKKARKEFQDMMDNINRILRLVITGEVEDDNDHSGSCSGDCAHCHGC